MSDSLRSKVIRLAHANPALRPHLLPLLAGSGRVAVNRYGGADPSFHREMHRQVQKRIKKLSLEALRASHTDGVKKEDVEHMYAMIDLIKEAWREKNGEELEALGAIRSADLPKFKIQYQKPRA